VGGTSLWLITGAAWGLYPMAAAVLLHLIIGVHNAWELADYLATLQ
jgi:hypothetical protein